MENFKINVLGVGGISFSGSVAMLNNSYTINANDSHIVVFVTYKSSKYAVYLVNTQKASLISGTNDIVGIDIDSNREVNIHNIIGDTIRLSVLKLSGGF